MISLLFHVIVVRHTYLYRTRRRQWWTDVFRSLYKIPMVQRGKTPPQLRYWWFVPLGKAQVSSHCHGARNSRLPHRIPRRVCLSLSLTLSIFFLFLSFSLPLYLSLSFSLCFSLPSIFFSCRTWRISNRGSRNNREFRGVDGTWTSIDVRAQTARTIVAGCLAFVILRSLVASFSRACFRSFVLSPTARSRLPSRSHMREFPFKINLINNTLHEKKSCNHTRVYLITCAFIEI